MPNPESHKRELTEEEDAMTVVGGPVSHRNETAAVSHVESIRTAEQATELMHKLAELIPDERTNLESAIANAREIGAEPVPSDRGYYTPQSGKEDFDYIAGTKIALELPDGTRMHVMEKSEELLDKQARELAKIDNAAYYGINNVEGMRREWLAYVVDRVFRLNMVPVTILKYGTEGLASRQAWQENAIDNKDITEINDWHDVPANNPTLQRLALTQALILNVDAHNKNVIKQSLNEAGLPDQVSQADNAMAMVTSERLPIKSDAWESMQGAMIKEDLMINHIDPFFEHPERQELLHEAFRIALGERHAEQEWSGFMQRVTTIAETGRFPKNERLVAQRKNPPDRSPEIWSLDSNTAS